MKNSRLNTNTSLCLILMTASSIYSSSLLASDAYANIQHESQLKAFRFADKKQHNAHQQYLDEINQEVNNTNAYQKRTKPVNDKVAKSSGKLNAEEILQRLKQLSTASQPK